MATAGVEGGPGSRVAVLVRANCPTCVRMEQVVREVCERAGERWVVVDVDAPDADPELRAEYSDVVPVTLVDGREVGSWSVSPDSLADALGGAPVTGATAVRASAPGSDTAILQTASSLVVLTASTYDSLRALPFGGGATAVPLVRDHLVAGSAALAGARDDLAEATRAAGARVQTAPDPRYAPLVAQALPTVRGPGDVVGLALTLEDVLAQTLTRDAVDLSTPPRRRLAAGLACRAAGRKALLLVAQSLVGVGAAELAVVPPDLAALPAGIGAVGFPDVSAPVDKASPPDEGALR